VKKRLTVLISEPNADERAQTFLPYVWGVLKTASDSYDDLADQFFWLDPIFQRRSVQEMLAPYDVTTVDVLGLSCYTWNFKLQCELARAVKAANSRCLIVAGGPDPDVKDKEFFRLHPYIDAVVVKDGELTFSHLLRTVAENAPLSGIGGLYLPNGSEREVVFTGPPKLPTDFTASPYLRQAAYYEAIIKNNEKTLFSMIWETNRGCPYSCSYCDWGSATMSKIRAFDLDRVKRDAEWIARSGCIFVFLADANFGILKRDIEIAETLTEAQRVHGYPRYFYYSPAKNNPDRSLAIARQFAQSGLSSRHPLAIQHTDVDVLASTDRQNISPEKQIALARAIIDAGYQVDVQLILGIPGDTYQKWKRCLTDVMEWGIHEEYFVFFYNLLPNAPAADPAFIERWGIKTLLRRSRHLPAEVPRGSKDRVIEERIVVESRSFGTEDWVRMYTYTCFIRALHGMGLTRLIAVYLRRSRRVPYREFYDFVIEKFFAEGLDGTGLYATIEDFYRRSLSHDFELNCHDIDRLPDFPYPVSSSSLIFIELCLRADEFYARLEKCLEAHFGSDILLSSITSYQKNLLIMPDYDADQGKEFALKHDWPGYFSKEQRTEISAVLDEPKPLDRGLARVSDMTCGDPSYGVWPLQWPHDDGARMHAWVLAVAFYRCSTRSTYFQKISVSTLPCAQSELPAEMEVAIAAE
jgi:putative methyltransferase